MDAISEHGSQNDSQNTQTSKKQLIVNESVQNER